MNILRNGWTAVSALFTVVGGISGIISLVQLIRNWKGVKQILGNPYSNMLLWSVIGTGAAIFLFYVFGGFDKLNLNKIDTNDGKVSELVKSQSNTNDSSTGDNIAIKAKYGIKTSGVTIAGFKNGIVAGHVSPPKDGAGITADDSSLLDLNNTQIYRDAPMLLDDTQYNTVGVKERHLSTDLLNYLTAIITDKTSNIFINTTGDNESKVLANEIAVALRKLNYRIIAQGEFGAVGGTMPTDKIEVRKNDDKNLRGDNNYNILIFPLNK